MALRLYAGHSFSGGERWPFHHYVVADLGVWLRSQGFSHQAVYRVELGTTPRAEGWDRLSLALRLNGVQTFNTGRGNGGSPSGLGDGLSFLSPGVDLSLRLVNTLRVGFSMDGAVYANNLPAAPNWQVYVSMER